MRHPHTRRIRRAPRPGFSLIELMVVFVIFGLVVAIGVPRFNYMRETSQMRSAKAQISSALATARATAVRRGRNAEMRRFADSVWVTTGTDIIVRPVRLNSQYGVTVDSGPALVRFDPRGIATNLAGARVMYRFRRSGYVDSVCVSGVGQVMRNGCM